MMEWGKYFLIMIKEQLTTITCSSATLSNAERNYCQYEREGFSYSFLQSKSFIHIYFEGDVPDTQTPFQLSYYLAKKQY